MISVFNVFVFIFAAFGFGGGIYKISKAIFDWVGKVDGHMFCADMRLDVLERDMQKEEESRRKDIKLAHEVIEKRVGEVSKRTQAQIDDMKQQILQIERQRGTDKEYFESLCRVSYPTRTGMS